MPYSTDDRRQTLPPLESLPSLAARTSAFYQQYLRKERPEVIALKAACQTSINESGIGERCLNDGDTMPLFCLPNAHGKQVSAADLLDKGPLVISFYRGSWCGFCSLEMKALQEALPYIREAGGELIAISPDVSQGPAEVIDALGLDFELLCDRGGEVSRQFGLNYLMDSRLHGIYKNDFGIDIGAINEDPDWQLPITATYIVGRDRRILQAFTDPDHTVRLEPADIVRRLRSHHLQEVSPPVSEACP